MYFAATSKYMILGSRFIIGNENSDYRSGMVPYNSYQQTVRFHQGRGV